MSLVRPWRKPLLTVFATLFSTAMILYSGLWIHSASRPILVELGFDNQYLADAHAQLVRSVVPGSPAERAGLSPGDQIVGINGTPLEEDTLIRFWSEHKPGDSVELLLMRPGEPTPLTVRGIFRASGASSAEAGMIGRLGRLINTLFPVTFVAVAVAVLFLRLEDRNAWLMALMFGSCIAIPGFANSLLGVPSSLRPFAIAYRGIFNNMVAALFYFFFADFPAPSPLDRRVPWLKWAGLSTASILALSALIAGARGDGAALGLTSRGFGHILVLCFNYGMIVLGFVSLTWNAISVSSSEARRKINVILWGTLVGVVPATLALAATDFLGFSLTLWMAALVILLLWLFPGSFAYAVVRHRVLGIPVLLRRSARYLLVQRGFILLLVIVSVGITLAFALIFANYLQSQTTVALPGSIALGAVFGTVMFWTGSRIHQDVGKRIDRAFFRSAYDAETILEDLVEKTRTATDRKELAALLEHHLKQALQPSSVVAYFETHDDRLSVMTGDVQRENEGLSRADPGVRELASYGRPSEMSGEAVMKTLPRTLLALNPDCLVPILGRDDRLVGLIVLGQRLSEEPYSGQDKHLLAAVANQTGAALESIRLGEKVAERIEAERRSAQEMAFARQVQTRLFPQKLPPMKTLDYTGQCKPARTVGGDYYDFLELRAGRLGMVLADIAGKGVPGALLMANLQANLRSQYAMAIDDLPRLLASVNRLFYESTDDMSYATLFFADYDDESRRLRYANCGHLPALLLRGDGGKVAWLPSTCTVVGLFENWQTEIAEETLAPGDTLVLYTDGITEAMNGSDEEFGEERLLDAVRNQSGLPTTQVMESVVRMVSEFSSGEQQDDITLVVARCLAWPDAGAINLPH